MARTSMLSSMQLPSGIVTLFIFLIRTVGFIDLDVRKTNFSCFALSAAAKKAASSNPEVSESKGEAGKGKEEVVNGEMEEESNGKKSEGAASGSKLRASRRSGAEASGAGNSWDSVMYILYLKDDTMTFYFF